MRQMNMHAVHLKQSHGINLLLQEVNAPEMPGNIEMEASVRESRRITYLTALYLLHLPSRGHLSQCLRSIELSGISRGLYLYTLAGYLHHVTLRRYLFVPDKLNLRSFLKHISPIP